MSLQEGRATLCVVNYKTEELTRLCLRSIRKYTQFPYRVIVVDNDSDDASLDYLRSLSWITLIERPGQVDRSKSGGWAHATALDLGLEACDTEFFVSLHSDTFIQRGGWLAHLVAAAEGDVAVAGGGKLEMQPRWYVWLKSVTNVKKRWRQRRSGQRNDVYVRTICALYRTAVLRKETLTFITGIDNGVTCGKQVYYDLVDRGYGTTLLPESDLGHYIFHLAHATMVVNPEFKVRTRTERKYYRRMKAIMDSPVIRDVRADDSLDA